jgi:hypothetical protein
MNKIKEILEIVSSFDLSKINGAYYAEVFEYDGKHSRWADPDLDNLINMIHDLFCE